MEDDQPFDGVQRLRFCRHCRQVDVWLDVSWVDFDEYVLRETSPQASAARE
jgi:hypothetical protein